MGNQFIGAVADDLGSNARTLRFYPTEIRTRGGQVGSTRRYNNGMVSGCYHEHLSIVPDREGVCEGCGSQVWVAASAAILAADAARIPS